MKKRVSRKAAENYMKQINLFHDNFGTPTVYRRPYTDFANLYNELTGKLYSQIVEAYYAKDYETMEKVGWEYRQIALKAYNGEYPFFDCYKRELEMKAEEKARREANEKAEFERRREEIMNSGDEFRKAMFLLVDCGMMQKIIDHAIQNG